MYDFKLPEKWCIKAKTIEEAELIAEYANPLNKLYDGCEWKPEDSLEYYLHINSGKYRKGHITIDSAYEKITFDQFKEHVLNIKEEEPIKKEEDYSYLIKLLEEYKLT